MTSEDAQENSKRYKVENSEEDKSEHKVPHTQLQMPRYATYNHNEYYTKSPPFS